MGWVYNLTSTSGPTTAPRFIAVIASLTILAIVAVCLRLYVRLGLKPGFGPDDLAIVFSAVMSCAYSICGILQTRWGQGLTAADFPLQNAYMFSLIQYAGSPFYTMGLLGFKLALLLAYLRISGFNPVHRVIIYVVLVATVLNQVVFTCLLMFSCHPIAYQWDVSIKGGYCINEVPPFYALAATTLFFDLVIIVLPLPILVRLQLETRRKVALICVFALGFFITIIQVIRMNYIKDLKSYTDSETIILWSSIEINLGILVSSIPTLSPLLHYLTTLSSTSSARKSSSSPGRTHQHEQHTGPSQQSKTFRTGHHARKSIGPYAFGHADTSVLVNSATDRADGAGASDSRASVGSNMFHMDVYPTKDEVVIGEQRTSLGGGNRTSVHGNVRLPLEGSVGVTREGGNVKNEGFVVGNGSGSGSGGGIRATTEVRVEFGER